MDIIKISDRQTLIYNIQGKNEFFSDHIYFRIDSQRHWLQRCIRADTIFLSLLYNTIFHIFDHF